MRIELIGVDTPEERDVIYHKVEGGLKNKLKLLKKPRSLSVHYKKHEKDGKRHRYNIHFRLESELGMLTTESEEWDLLEAIDRGIDDLEEIIRRAKDRMKD